MNTDSTHNSFFFFRAEKNQTNSQFVESIESIALGDKVQIYIIDGPLADEKYGYSYQDKLIFLSPGHKIALVNFSQDERHFEEFCDDFIEDLASLSDKYD